MTTVFSSLSLSIFFLIHDLISPMSSSSGFLTHHQIHQIKKKYKLCNQHMNILRIEIDQSLLPVGHRKAMIYFWKSTHVSEPPELNHSNRLGTKTKKFT